MKKIITTILALMLNFSVSAAESKKATELLLTPDNTISLSGEVNAESVGKVMKKASEMNSSLPSGYPIYLFLNTPGGSIQDGLELFEYLKGVNRPVHTITLFAASMGFQTAQQLGTRYILRYGVLMSHKARGGFQGEFGDGMSQVDSRYGLWMRRIEMLDRDTVARTNGKQTLESYRTSYSSELWLNGQEAVDRGYADEVAVIKCSNELNAKTEEQEFSNGFFSVKATFSGCPINTSPLSVTANVVTNKGVMTVEDFSLKGGKFGSDCRSSEETSDRYGSEPTVIKSELCLLDKAITLDQIKNTIKEKKDILKKDFKNRIIYSY